MPSLTTLICKHLQQLSHSCGVWVGGLTIGQAGKFDEPGSQAVEALRELFNPSIASDEAVDYDFTNDGSSKGIAHMQRPSLPVQFRPEVCFGPFDTAFFSDESGVLPRGLLHAAR